MNLTERLQSYRDNPTEPVGSAESNYPEAMENFDGHDTPQFNN